MVRSIDARADGAVDVMVSLTTPGCPIRSHFENAVAQAVGALDGVTARRRRLRRALRPGEGRRSSSKLGRGALPEGALAQVANVVCVGSGKGGVGKSTITANLAAALAAEGKKRRRRSTPTSGATRSRACSALGGQRRRSRRERKILPLEARRRQGHVDRLLRRGGLRRRLARADAPQGADASSSRTSSGASSTTCSSTCRPAPATSR